jgi:hypothetical protein
MARGGVNFGRQGERAVKRDDDHVGKEEGKETASKPPRKGFLEAIRFAGEKVLV